LGCRRRTPCVGARNRVVAKPTKHGDKWRIRWLDERGERQSAVFDDYRRAQTELSRHHVEVEERVVTIAGAAYVVTTPVAVRLRCTIPRHRSLRRLRAGTVRWNRFRASFPEVSCVPATSGEGETKTGALSATPCRGSMRLRSNETSQRICRPRHSMPRARPVHVTPFAVATHIASSTSPSSLCPHWFCPQQTTRPPRVRAQA
jgi:hypothetical protein